MAHFNWVSRIGGQVHKGKLDAADLDLPVTEARARAASKAGLPADGVTLLYCGKILKDGDAARKTLRDWGMKAGSTLHVLKKPDAHEDIPMEPRELSEDDVKQFYIAFGMAMRNPAFNVVIKRLTSDKENLQSLAAACPGLAQDHVALALLSKPETLVMLLSVS